MFDAGLIVAGVLLVFALVTVSQGVRMVSQGEEWVVERLGKYHVILRPGLNFTIPYLDRVAYRLVTKDISTGLHTVIRFLHSELQAGFLTQIRISGISERREAAATASG